MKIILKLSLFVAIGFVSMSASIPDTGVSFCSITPSDVNVRYNGTRPVGFSQINFACGSSTTLNLSAPGFNVSSIQWTVVYKEPGASVNVYQNGQRVEISGMSGGTVVLSVTVNTTSCGSVQLNNAAFTSSCR